VITFLVAAAKESILSFAACRRRSGVGEKGVSGPNGRRQKRACESRRGPRKSSFSGLTHEHIGVFKAHGGGVAPDRERAHEKYLSLCALKGGECGGLRSASKGFVRVCFAFVHHDTPTPTPARAPCQDDGGPRPMCTGCARSFLDERGARLGRGSSRAFRARAASSTPRCARAALPAHNLTGSRCPTPLHPPFRRAVRARRSDVAGARARGQRGRGTTSGSPHSRAPQWGPASLPPTRPHRENRMAPKLIASEPEGRAHRARDARGVGEFDHDGQTDRQ
jgi:hypothetical protein